MFRLMVVKIEILSKINERILVIKKEIRWEDILDLIENCKVMFFIKINK